MVAAFFIPVVFMGWKTVIIGSECTVSLTLNRMKITIGNQYQNIPLTDLNTVIFSHDKTVITISHRLSTTRLADRIYLLEHGRIIESGTHDQLMQQQGKYAQMFTLQAQKYQY